MSETSYYSSDFGVRVRRTWKDAAQQVIREVEEQHPDSTDEELRTLISAAYPFGERRMWPYKVWLREVKAAEESRQRRRRWKAGGW